MVLSWGSGNDKCEAMELMGNSAQAIMPKKLFADAGYDADWVHVFSREVWKAESWIPPVTHRRDGTLGGEYRPLMTEEYLKELRLYETLESGIIHERLETNGWFHPVSNKANSHDDRSRSESPDLRPAALARRG